MDESAAAASSTHPDAEAPYKTDLTLTEASAVDVGRALISPDALVSLPQQPAASSALEQMLPWVHPFQSRIACQDRCSKI